MAQERFANGARFESRAASWQEERPGRNERPPNVPYRRQKAVLTNHRAHNCHVIANSSVNYCSVLIIHVLCVLGGYFPFKCMGRTSLTRSLNGILIKGKMHS